MLVADDNAINRLIAQRLVEREAHSVQCVADGHEVLDVLNKGTQFDVILMDCQMPGLDGYETTRIIRAAKGASYTAIPIVAITASPCPAIANPAWPSA